MPRQVLIPIADGSEDIEVVTIIDTLRRAGAQVTIASCHPDGKQTITASQKTQITADVHVEACTGKQFHLIALPGGMPGADSLKNNKTLTTLLHDQQKAGKWYAAICASPAVVLAHHGLLDNVHATCHPSFMDQMEGALAHPENTTVVDEKKRVITAQGPGNAMGFSFKLVDALYGKDAFRPIAKQMIADWAL
ncbi:DJ-1 family glyoxalase III [Endozoicomonas sp. SCSIO W0465]|uniref:DJ-1 family glyoxalase III n=1 Tax=Endozoicomonas sp. SCSIO W0465 TaxID=2918516 RepID=UPI0020754F0C|nr:DJ-1 family glyoxalase III [Endozoicomonas sp. SCSIO W0465]USE39033.1 DJ-1/PfpI family protein [Endozoicomonas sp. SCSIO W0465]